MSLLLVLFVFSIRAKDCADNYFFPWFQEFVLEKQNQDLMIIKQMNLYLNQSKQTVPLTTCSQFSQQSCCTIEFEQALGNVTMNYFLQQEDQSFPFTSIIQSMQTAILNCGLRDPSNYKSILNSTLDGMQSALFEYRQLVAELLVLNTRFLRGNLCILCATSDSISSYAKYTSDPYSLKLVINSTSYNQYLKDTSAVLQSLQNMIPVFKQLLSKYFTEYADTTKCASILVKFTTYMDDLNFCVGGDCLTYLKQRVNYFNQEVDQELIYLAAPDLGYNSSSSQRLLWDDRILTEQDNFQVSTTGGLQTYIADDEIDALVMYQGVYSISYNSKNSQQFILMLTLIYLMF